MKDQPVRTDVHAAACGAGAGGAFPCWDADAPAVVVRVPAAPPAPAARPQLRRPATALSIPGAEAVVVNAHLGMPDIERGADSLTAWVCRCVAAGAGEGDEQVAADTVAATIACAGRHFRDEERLMSQARFPSLGRHTLDHQRALATLHALRATTGGRDLAARVGTFLGAWVGGHDRTLDREFAHWLDSGVRGGT